jgi:hypothetical protein
MARPLSAVAVLVLLLAWSVGGLDAAAQTPDETCLTALDQAERQYRNGDYDASVQLLSACLDRTGIADSIATSAYRLLALSHLRSDNLERARLAVVNLLGVDPGFRPDPVADPPPFVSLVAVVREQIQTPLPSDSIAPVVAQNPDLATDPAAGANDAARPSRPTPFFRRTSTWLALGGSLLVGGVVSLVTATGGTGGGGGEPPPPTPPADLPPPPGVPPP